MNFDAILDIKVSLMKSLNWIFVQLDLLLGINITDIFLRLWNGGYWVDNAQWINGQDKEVQYHSAVFKVKMKDSA